MMQSPLVDFSLSIPEWLGFFKQLFDMVNDLFIRLFGKPLFKDSDAGETEETTTEG